MYVVCVCMLCVYMYMCVYICVCICMFYVYIYVCVCMLCVCVCVWPGLCVDIMMLFVLTCSGLLFPAKQYCHHACSPAECHGPGPLQHARHVVSHDVSQSLVETWVDGWRVWFCVTEAGAYAILASKPMS